VKVKWSNCCFGMEQIVAFFRKINNVYLLVICVQILNIPFHPHPQIIIFPIVPLFAIRNKFLEVLSFTVCINLIFFPSGLILYTVYTNCPLSLPHPSMLPSTLLNMGNIKNGEKNYKLFCHFLRVFKTKN
jgi:hypothetical protein